MTDQYKWVETVQIVIQTFTLYRSKPRPATSTPAIDDPPRKVTAALVVGEAEALELAPVTAAELDAAPLTPAFEIMLPGAVKILVGTVVGIAFVAAITIPPAAVAAVGVAAAPPSDSETTDWPVLRTM